MTSSKKVADFAVEVLTALSVEVGLVELGRGREDVLLFPLLLFFTGDSSNVSPSSMFLGRVSMSMRASTSSKSRSLLPSVVSSGVTRVSPLFIDNRRFLGVMVVAILLASSSFSFSRCLAASSSLFLSLISLFLSRSSSIFARPLLAFPDRVVIILFIASLIRVVVQTPNRWEARSNLSYCQEPEIWRVRKSMERSYSWAIADGLQRFPDVTSENRVGLVDREA